MSSVSPRTGTRADAVSQRPVTPAIGSLIEGLDLGALSDTDFAMLRGLVERRGVVFVRGQSLEPGQLVAFARRFGPLQPSAESAFSALPGHPEVDVLEADAEHPPLVTTELWHTAFTSHVRPTMGTVLHGRIIPESGGDTIWVSLEAAWEHLSAPLRAYLQGLRAEHRGAKAFADQIRMQLWTDAAGQERLRSLLLEPPAVHPVVRTHPVTGRKSLFVNEGYTTLIQGLHRKESDAVLGYLFDHLRTPEFQVRHRWQAGDVAIWDNRCTMHYAVADYRGHRLMHRVTIEGDVPV